MYSIFSPLRNSTHRQDKLMKFFLKTSQSQLNLNPCLLLSIVNCPFILVSAKPCAVSHLLQKVTCFINLYVWLCPSFVPAGLKQLLWHQNPD